MIPIPDLQSQIASKILSVDEAFARITEARTIVASMAASEPQSFFEALGEKCSAFKKRVRVFCANPSRSYACFQDPALCRRLDLVVMFLTASVRAQQGRELVHYFPQHLSQWAGLIAEQGVDVFWGSCSLPDERGFVSLGPSACYEPEMARVSKSVMLEINPRMPVTFGSTQLHLRDVDGFIETDHPLPALAKAKSDEVDHKIAAYVADLVEDGSTIQLGIGSIPNAVGEALSGKKDLGVHTEMINDAIMDLYLKGVVTGACKTRWPGKIIGSFAYGTEDLYRFLDRNPTVELHPASVVNDPWRLGRNHKQVSINTAVEVDLTGQVCSESVGHRELSGVGGASETHIGAQRSPGGRGIIALHSLTARGESKIVFELKPGAKVSISRNDIDTVVTEYGVARLKGKSVAERAQAMVAIAHPRVRDELLRGARRECYL